MATPAAHPSGVALWCKRCDVGFYGNACARQHQRFAFTKVLPLGQAPPAWGRALWAYGQDQEPQPGCLPFAPGALITVIPWGCGPAASRCAKSELSGSAPALRRVRRHSALLEK